MLNILIVEDDSQLAVTLKYLVEDNPRYRVVGIAEDADGAIAAAEEHQPDLVLLDLHLPDIDGDEVLARLRADASTAAIPDVIIRADATPGQISRLPDEAVYRRRRAPFARSRRRPAARSRVGAAENAGEPDPL